jgi:hypothetical protein
VEGDFSFSSQVKQCDDTRSQDFGFASIADIADLDLVFKTDNACIPPSVGVGHSVPGYFSSLNQI